MEYQQLTNFQEEVPERLESFCCECWCWFINIFVLAFFIVSGIVLASIRDDTVIPFLLFPFVFVYFVYFITMILSPVFQFLKEKKETYTEINTKMREYFKARPEIKFDCECYHEETSTETVTDSEGKETTETITENVYTHKESLNLPYYSARDISGLFLLNAGKAKKTPKTYIKLIIDTEINFADAISYSDYISQKEAFRQKNIDKDEKMNFKEKQSIPGIQKENNVKFTDQEPGCVSCCLLFLLSFLMLGQFYKSYLNRCFIVQHFKIKKLISTRYNLMDEDNSQRFSSLNPRLKVSEKEYTYGPEDIGYVNEEKNFESPTEKELNAAKEYQHKIPNFCLESVGGAENVQDTPQSQNAYCNQHLSGYANFEGDVPLSSEQLQPKPQEMSKLQEISAGTYNNIENQDNNTP